MKYEILKYEISIPGYSVRLAKEEEVEKVLRFLEDNFDREETLFKNMYANSLVTEEEDRWIKEDHRNLSKGIFHSSPCLLAFHESSKDKIIGINMTVITPNPRRKTEGEILDDCEMKSRLMKKYVGYLNGVGERAELFDKVFPNAEIGVEFFAIAVAKEHRRLGLSAELTKAGVSLAETIPKAAFVFGICTSAYSVKSAEKVGLRTVLRVDGGSEEENEQRDESAYSRSAAVSVMAMKLYPK